MSLHVRYFFLLLTAAGLFSFSACRQQRAAPPSGPPAVPVMVARAEQATVPFELKVVGTVEASSIVQVKSQIAGELIGVHFKEGQNVARGDLLFEIDAQPYRDALRQAEANLSRDRALIRQAEASMARDLAQSKNAEIDAARYAELEKDGVASRSQYEQSRTSADVYRESALASRAGIESAKAAVESDLAAVERAKLDIGYCAIRSPLAGRTGNLLVHPGNLVKVNDAPLVVIHQVSPIFVNFNVPEEHLAAIRRLSATRKLPVRVWLQGDAAQAATGLLTVIDNTVDSTTGTIRLKAVLDNRNGMLWPGQFVSVVLTLEATDNAIVVPGEAVQAGQQGQFVYVVKPDRTVEIRVVTAGRTFDHQMVIERGLAAGETVVTDGQLRLFPGATVRVVDPAILGAGKP